MTGMIISDSCLNIIRESLPTLIKDINSCNIRKYAKHGILEPSEEDLKYIRKMENDNLTVLAIIDSNMFYKDIKLEVTNYIYISKDYVPSNSIKGLKMKALVLNKTWKIESNGIVCIDEINGNLVRIY